MKIPKPIILTCKEVNKGQDKSDNRYQMIHSNNRRIPLGVKTSLSQNRNLKLPVPTYWLNIWQGNKRSKYNIELFKTNKSHFFWGDFHNKEHNLVIIKFFDNLEIVFIYFYRNYFTTNISKILESIRE